MERCSHGSAPDAAALIDRLAADLRPVRRLPPPAARAAAWMLAVAALGAAMAWFADLEAVSTRLAGAADLRLATLGSALTAPLAALAAFQLAVPGRPRRWALLPLPAALLWLGASGAGCLRVWAAGGGGGGRDLDCVAFILATSLPLSLLLVAMLRRACPLRPGPTAALGGLAAAAAAATLLVLHHPVEATFLDLGLHAAAVAAVVLASRAWGGAALARAVVGPSPAARGA